jgi:carbon-monoxide dehydrogenase medium subunit
MHDFEYRRPSSLAEAVEALKAAPDGKLLAGGMSLVPILKLGMAMPTELISLRRVEELRGIVVTDGKLRIGAASTHAQVAAAPQVRETIPALARLADAIGDPQVRNRGTLGGSIAHADPAADYPAALVALDATVHTNRRAIAAGEFFRGMFETALAPDEIIVSVELAVPEKAAYAKFVQPASRFAVVGVFVAKSKAGVRVAVTGAATSVFRVAAMEEALAKKLTPDAIAGISVARDDLISDLHASAEYRAHLVGVMAKRAVAACG